MESRVNPGVVEKADTLFCVEQNECQMSFEDTYPELQKDYQITVRQELLY